MVVSKPLEKTVDQKTIDKLIDKGARVKEDNKDDEEKMHYNLNLRVPVDLFLDMEEVHQKRVGISRTGWILEAIQEKIRRDSNDHI